MSLAEWREFGWLVEHQATAVEIRDLLRVVDRDLADARVSALSSDTRLKLAYNAALQSAAAALAACGYRAVRDGYHKRVIQTLRFTLQVEPVLVTRLDSFRRMRHTGDYERAGITSEEDADSILKQAEEIAARVRAWLKASHPELVGVP
jgi:uncharacterized protein (UPF0332 family)